MLCRLIDRLHSHLVRDSKRLLSISKTFTASHSVSTMSCSTVDLRHMTIKVLPALRDNYMYLLIDKTSRETAVVDPVEPNSVVRTVKAEGLQLKTVLTTHHHYDHAGGNEKLVDMATGLTVCGNDDRIGALNKTVKHNNQLKVGSLNVRCLETPCHTTGHICYYVTSEDQSDKVVFTGDTLFIGGCGRFFEGTAEQMHHALCDILAALPPETSVFCGHEYTVSNLIFAQHIEPSNSAITEKLKWAKEQREKDIPTVPSTIGQELTFNPFMRVSDLSMQKYCSTSDPIPTMKALREEKNNFKPKNL